MQDIVRTAADARGLPQPPLLVLDALEAYLDALGIGEGPIEASQLGEGHSNPTFLLRRGGSSVVLRRPPRPPLPPSAHDVIREGRIVRAMSGAGVRVPIIIDLCEDTDVVGAPFCLMERIDGEPLGELGWPAENGAAQDCRALAEELVDALIEIHAVDWRALDVATIARPEGFLERQLRRFSALARSDAATRELPHLDVIEAWLAAHMPPQSDATMVHGDYRSGNVLFARHRPPHLLAVLDWELATLGDPLADVGYLLATYAEQADDDDPMLSLSTATAAPGFPSRRTIAERYAARSGRDVSGVRWYMVLALFRSVVFLENSYRRHLAGTTSDPFFANLEQGVPRLAERAWRLTQGPADDLSDRRG
jgi:aminoglycoside phosphotransferase (APT) family kinase protein